MKHNLANSLEFYTKYVAALYMYPPNLKLTPSVIKVINYKVASLRHTVCSGYQIAITGEYHSAVLYTCIMRRTGACEVKVMPY
jgi:hypothetical protein